MIDVFLFISASTWVIYLDVQFISVFLSKKAFIVFSYAFGYVCENAFRLWNYYKNT